MTVDGTCKDITRSLKRYDRELYCARNGNGVRCVYRKGKRYECVATFDDGAKLYSIVPSPEFIFALTDNWAPTGMPRAWGIDAILYRIKQIDSWDNERLFAEMDANNEKVDKSKERAFMNETEAFLSDYRRPLAKAFEDINTTSLDKSDKRKRLKDKKEEFKIKGRS